MGWPWCRAVWRVSEAAARVILAYLKVGLSRGPRRVGRRLLQATRDWFARAQGLP